jgi:hypothetical protein
MRYHKTFRALLFIFLLLSTYLISDVQQARAAEWQVELDISNGAGVNDTIAFGVHPDGTEGIDPALGEVGLPPWPPSSLYEVRFLVPGSEGVHLDLRDTTHTQRFHTIKWQAGSGGYPVTVRWDRASLPYASLYISDGYGGVFIPPVNMYEMDSLQVPASMSYILQLTLDVTPGANPNAYPEIGPFPDAAVYLGQQFAEYNLDDYVFDPDTPDHLIEWIVSDDEVLLFEIDEDRVMTITAPPGWTGDETVTLTTRDPEMHTDQATVTFSVIESGLPAWTVPMTVRNSAEEIRQVYFGIHPEGTDGIDTDLGEVSLPPWPPSSAFDARFQLLDLVTWSVRDVRQSSPDTITYHLKWQPGDGGYPVTVEWPSDLPLGEFIIKDDMGGLFVPPVNMADTTAVEITDTFITGVIITALAVVDTTPPNGPAWLATTGRIPGVSIDLEWPQCMEEHFAYYEILYGPVEIHSEAEYVWDWTEDATLMSIETTSTTVFLPAGSDTLRFWIRAWDTFGNVSEVSNPVITGVETDKPAAAPLPVDLHAWPNPFHNQVTIGFTAAGSGNVTVSIYDVAGRRLRTYTQRLSRDDSGTVVWDGRDASGVHVSSGMYFCVFRTKQGTISQKIVLVR